MLSNVTKYRGDLVHPKSDHLAKCSSNFTSPILQSLLFFYFFYFSWDGVGLNRVSFSMEMQSTSNVVQFILDYPSGSHPSTDICRDRRSNLKLHKNPQGSWVVRLIDPFKVVSAILE